jgi:Holliday junction resolvase RusA-like endonuclease
MSRRITFTVPGKPQPAGSKRAFPFKRRDGKLGVAVTDSNPRAKDWKALVSQIAADAMVNVDGFLDKPITGPVRLWVVFYLERPKSHYGTGRNASILKPQAPRWHAIRADATKLLRGLEDALKGIAWIDDGQVAHQEAKKLWANSPSTLVAIMELNDA